LKTRLLPLLLLALTAHAQAPLFSAPIAPLTPQQRAAMTGKSWKPGCPVSLDDLASVRVTYWGFDNQTHQGTIVLHKRFAPEAYDIFNQLYSARFPIYKVDLWDSYGPDVYAQQDITVGFYCQHSDDDPNQWNSHAYGLAIDLNPRENPFQNPKSGWWPASSAVFAPRDNGQGKISPDSPAFRIFMRHGWVWGGFSPGSPDLMQFSKLTYGGSGSPLDRPYTATSLQSTPEPAPQTTPPQ